MSVAGVEEENTAISLDLLFYFQHLVWSVSGFIVKHKDANNCLNLFE